MTVLRLRINNETGNVLYNTKVKYFIKKGSEHPVVDVYDLRGASASLDSSMDDIWTLIINIDTLPSGISV